MQILEKSIDNATVLHIADQVVLMNGETQLAGAVSLEHRNSEIFEESVANLLSLGIGKIIVNMDKVVDSDSQGLQAIVNSARNAKSHSTDMILINTSVELKRALEITKISKNLIICDSEEEALVYQQSTLDTVNRGLKKFITN